MACPLFIPSLPLGELATIAAPLGDLYDGQCATEGEPAIEPQTLRLCCNFGYARGRCPRAAQSAADAVRFMVRGARGSVVEIAWALERNHHPVAVGNLEIETAASVGTSADVLTRQAYSCGLAYARHGQTGSDSAGRVAMTAHP